MAKEEQKGNSINWQPAVERLKAAVEDHSIDRYFKKQEIAELRTRFNNKERTHALYDAIMRL